MNTKSTKPHIGVCTSNGFVFVPIPKNASTTFRTGFFKDQTEISLPLTDDNSSKTFFSIFRNPFERFIAGFLELNQRSWSSYKDYPIFHNITKKSEWYNTSDPIERFLKFIDTIDIYDDVEELHILNQTFFYNKAPKIDYLLDFNTLNDSMTSFCKEYKIETLMGSSDIPIEWPCRQKSYRSMLYTLVNTNSEVKDKIRARVQDDIDFYIENKLYIVNSSLIFQ